MSVIVAIPARLESTRFPRKDLADINGHPMLWHVFQGVSKAKTVDAIWVVTDSQEVKELVTSWGGKSLLTSPDCPSGTARIASVINQLEADIVINVQGDEPLIEPEVIERALDAARTREGDVVTLMTPMKDPAAIADPNRVKVVVDRDGYALYFSRSPIPSSGDCFLHLGLYAYTVRFLRSFVRLETTQLEKAERLEQLRILEHGYRIRVVEVLSDSWGIDTPSDLAAFQTLLERNRVKSVNNG